MRRLLAVACASVLVAGCGSSGSKSNGEAAKTPDQIIADVKSAVSSANSVHITGAGDTNGRPLSFDLHLTRNGGVGHIQLGGLGFDIARIGPKLYFKGDKQFVSHYAGPAAAELIAGKWFYVRPSVTGFESFKPLTDMVAFTNQILSSHGKLEKGATRTIGGQETVEVKDTSGGGSLFIATTGSAYPIQLEAGNGNTGSLTFTDWNKAVALAAPQDPIDYGKLIGSR
jgi:hypothetical protein